ncbi:MAG: hypothetical protein NT009_07265 [Proteobacteria bacterium]|nr:hypothetical protein [Pseudomonadota bacterium]
MKKGSIDWLRLALADTSHQLGQAARLFLRARKVGQVGQARKIAFIFLAPHVPLFPHFSPFRMRDEQRNQPT